MIKYCIYCGIEIDVEETYCLACGKSEEKTYSTNNNIQLNTRLKRLSTLSIVFGVIGIYPLIGIGGIIGMKIAKKGLKLDSDLYKKQLKFGYWLSFSGLAFWLIAFSIFLISIAYTILKDVWEIIKELIQLLY